MTTTSEYAQLSLYVYNIQADADQDNRPLLPSPTIWERLEYQPDNSYGFSYGVFRNNATASGSGIGVRSCLLLSQPGNLPQWPDHSALNSPARSIT
jgi:hypothetical protein